LSYTVLPWLDVDLGTVGGGFLASGAPAGALLAPTAGARAYTLAHGLEPYAMLDVGAAVTGALVRPLLRLGIGVDVPLSRAFSVGPVLGYGQVVQWDGPRYSTDARFVWAGVALVYRPVARPAQPAPVPRFMRKPAPLLAAPPESESEPVPPSPELLELIDQATPGDADRVELLAPVLFRFDSDELDPIGVAMLHEVARVLAQRADIELLSIHGYADRRGDADYNRALSLRRANRVREWLIAHDVAPERLVVSAEGASDFVESGTTETDHEQNRRVIFRVLRTRER
jgi:outer membrane protein OmpA-like peptidoglycan-associated protein